MSCTGQLQEVTRPSSGELPALAVSLQAQGGLQLTATLVYLANGKAPASTGKQPAR